MIPADAPRAGPVAPPATHTTPPGMDAARHTATLRGVPTDDDIEALRTRNLLRQKAAREALGAKWLGHPMNRPAPPLAWPSLADSSKTVSMPTLTVHRSSK